MKAKQTRHVKAQQKAVSAPLVRERGKGDTVALTVRLPRAEWVRLHQLAVSEGVSIQAFAVHGLNLAFRERRLPEMNVQQPHSRKL